MRSQHLGGLIEKQIPPHIQCVYMSSIKLVAAVIQDTVFGWVTRGEDENVILCVDKYMDFKSIVA